MSIRLSCPSCNTAFALDAVPAGRRATCPRCGDAFPVRGEMAEPATAADAGPPAAPVPSPASETRSPRRRVGMWSIRRTALVALALGGIGFVIGLTAYYSPKAKPNGDPPGQPPAVSNTTPPAQLAGLGYLPADYNVVFAVQPGPLLTYAARTHQEPRDLLTRAGVPAQALAALAALAALDSIGLTLPQIDHVAGGALLGNEGDGLRIAFVLVLKQPLADEDEFLKKLKAKPAAGKKTRFTVELAQLARVSPTVWVFGLSDKDLAAVDQGGYGPGGKQFRGSESDGLRQMIGSVPPDSAAWVAADDDREWTQKPLVTTFLPLSPGAKKGLSGLSSFRAGVFALSFGEQPRVRIFFRTADSAVAEHARLYLRARATEMEAATAGGGGVFALFDAPFDPATAKGTLQRFLADAVK
ncbi:zinc ribbon domain-containing protein [Frigoriglobus tundricola]|uniref:Zinc finger/thioredoxin putative domain-containing protein n=1 Tax=Frigoriglobus tundricola TaxID=2774151 RepID=A0A6M5YPS5_9BACT|nr:hypothetical protein [Frigoriglobus tundricola]QJW96047.1 hypothetical protein FTUN_3601 [Frigoriglobus tundricola]